MENFLTELLMHLGSAWTFLSILKPLQLSCYDLLRPVYRENDDYDTNMSTENSQIEK